MEFEKYNTTFRTPYITLDGTRMRFSNGFIKKYKPKKYVSLYYSGETDEIGMVFTDKLEEDCLKVTQESSISVAKFLYCMGIEATGRYYNIRKEDGMIIINLGGIKK